MIRRVATGMAVVAVGGWALCEAAVTVAAWGRTFDRIEDVPAREAALVLGTSKFVSPGRQNLHYRYRIEAAAALFKAGKVQRLIVSGNGAEVSYNEPRMMKNDLVRLGVPASRIVSDNAGLRTYDSVVRAEEVFNAADCVVVSQGAHNARAIFIGRMRGQDMVGWNAQPVKFSADPRTAIREHLARIKAVVDVIIPPAKGDFHGNALSWKGGPR